MNEDLKFGRRGFLLSVAAFAAGALGLGGRSWAAGDAGLPAGKKAVSETDTMAAALRYKHDASKSEGKGKSQTCANCNFYMKDNEGWGKCTLLQTGLVASKGWCASWVKKA